MNTFENLFWGALSENNSFQGGKKMPFEFSKPIKDGCFCSPEHIVKRVPHKCFEIDNQMGHYIFFSFLNGQAAWEIFTPLLHRIDNGELKPTLYQPGSRGPEEADQLLERSGYVQTHGYIWIPPTL